jgi:hypothetical protein
MKKMTILLAAAAFMLFGAAVSPASAQVVKDSACLDHGVNWDCHFHVSNYTVGSPVTLTINYTCPGGCGPVMSFGLQDKGFTPAGATGHLIGGSRNDGSLQLTFVFDSLGKTGNHEMGTGNFVMNMMADDGSGGMTMVSCPVDIRVKSTKD